MHRSRISPRHMGGRVASALMLGVLAGCAEPTAPTTPASPSAIIIIGGHPIVLTAQLRAIGNPNEIGNPDEKPPNAVVGHLQLKITESEEAGLVVTYQVHFANPECEASSSFGGGNVYIQDSEEMPSPEDLAVLRLIPPGDPLGCGDSFLEGSSSISESLAALLIQDPENFVAAFFLGGGGVITGSLRLAGSDVLETR